MGGGGGRGEIKGGEDMVVKKNEGEDFQPLMGGGSNRSSALSSSTGSKW